MNASFHRRPKGMSATSDAPFRALCLSKRFIAVVLVLWGWWGSAAALAADDIVFATDDLTIETQDGQRYDFKVELAVTPQQRQRGLMYRQDMAADAGMLFLFDREAPRSFWMKNTFIPLDLLFIDAEGVIVSIAPDAIPHDESPIPSHVPAAAVLELNAGTVENLGLSVGDHILYRTFGL